MLCYLCGEHGGNTCCAACSSFKTDTAVAIEIQLREWLSHSAMSCLSQQHLIRTLLSAVLRSTRYDRVSGRKHLPLTNEQLSQTKRIRKIMRRKQLTSPQLILVLQSRFLMVVTVMRPHAIYLWWM